MGTSTAAALFVLGFAAVVFFLVARATNRGPDLAELVQEEVLKGALVIDVRGPAEFAEGHVAGAVNVPVDELPARLGELPSDRAVVVYCRSGARSARAAEVLRAAGRRVVDARTRAAFRQ